MTVKIKKQIMSNEICIQDAPVYAIRSSENKLLATVTHYQIDAPYIRITYGLPGRVYRFKCPHCECGDWREDGPGYRFECESCGESTEFLGNG